MTTTMAKQVTDEIIGPMVLSKLKNISVYVKVTHNKSPLECFFLSFSSGSDSISRGDCNAEI